MSYKDDITPGEWFRDAKNRIWSSRGPEIGNIKDELDAQLIAEAGTVCNETGKTPRELQQELDEALAALGELVDILEVTEGEPEENWPSQIAKANNVLSKHKGDKND